MAWWIGILAQHRRAGIVTGVTAVHVAALVALFSHVFQPTIAPDREFLEIELAEIEGPPPEPEQVSETEPVPEPLEEAPPEQVATEAPPLEAPVPSPPQVSAAKAEPEAQSVLTQIEQSATSTVTSDTGGDDLMAASTGDSGVTPAQIASVLQQADCLKLKRHEEGACPEPDPFAVAIASAKRAIPAERLFDDPRYIAKTVSDKFFEEEASNRFLWPDEDLFTDPMSPGAYNARRIRNGQEPLWSKEMRDGFKNRD